MKIRVTIDDLSETLFKTITNEEIDVEALQFVITEEINRQKNGLLLIGGVQPVVEEGYLQEGYSPELVAILIDGLKEITRQTDDAQLNYKVISILNAWDTARAEAGK